MRAAILNDLTRCIGCQACVWACKESNRLPRDDGARRLSATTFSALHRRRGVNVRRQCMHCEDPACVSVCPVGALQKTKAGPIDYDESKCIGCRYCMLACPFDIPKYEWNATVPRVRKCMMCYQQLVRAGEQPACTRVCPTAALRFGDRKALLAEAHRRIAAHPGRYVDHVYGEHEAGGTAVLYLSPIPFDLLGLPTYVRHDPYPRLTWSVLSRLPQVVSVAGIALIGIWWIVRRRQQLMSEGEPDDGDAPEEGGR